jgi:putative DNA primase/helicase
VLSDGTGSRRFWPARVRRVDLEWLRANRDQLWAEAAHYYREGAPWWLPDPVEAARRTEASTYFETDAWQDAIGSFVVGQSSITTADLLDGALKLDRSQQHAGTTRRVAAIMRGLGWQKKAKRDPITGQRRQTWTAPQKKEIQKRG